MVSAPFFAAAMLDAENPIHYPPDEWAEGGESEKAKGNPYAQIPMAQTLQRYARELHQAGQAPPRKIWMSKWFPTFPESEAEFFTPLLYATLLADCWRQMEADHN